MSQPAMPGENEDVWGLCPAKENPLHQQNVFIGSAVTRYLPLVLIHMIHYPCSWSAQIPWTSLTRS
jgi:hypothetical protein